MKASELRQSFLDFFQKKQHQIVPSASLLPTAPNLLFTNAGMNPFLPYFLGERSVTTPRIADTQKCIRAGGKHNDLEEVGLDTYHHTFFEMLGNWSFGDYFKKEAIQWAWELLTQVWQLPKERLYATVYRPEPGEPAEFDQESYDLWHKVFSKEGLDPQIHIHYGAKKDNFWAMGETGPCGPCTEIHIDLTPRGNTQGKLVNTDSSLCLELWNLVFIQYNATELQGYQPLNAHFVDTGIGLERIAGLFAATECFQRYDQPISNYTSELFVLILQTLESLASQRYGNTLPKNPQQLSAQEHVDYAFRVLADHIRTLTFAIADGILPSNEGRGYVLRRILRRALLFAHKLKLPSKSFTALHKVVLDLMGKQFPELLTHQALIENTLAQEEFNFEKTLDKGLQLLEKKLSSSKNLSGEEAFLLYDTYGFPVDLTRLIVREKGGKIDEQGFKAAMLQQRERARASQKKTIIATQSETKKATPFIGYDPQALEGFPTKLKAILQDEKQTFLVFEQTPFYSEKGGQISDTGFVVLGNETIPILDTVQDALGCVLHRIKQGVGYLTGHANTMHFAGDFLGASERSTETYADVGEVASAGAATTKLEKLKRPEKEATQQLKAPQYQYDLDTPVKLFVNRKRRKAISLSHTAAHLLHWALREVLGAHIQQSGSWVGPESFRFDFSHPVALTPEQVQAIENLCNEKIRENLTVQTHLISIENKPSDCLAFFKDKYGDEVRMVQIGSLSKELCGGTHISQTGEMGLLVITKTSAIAAGIRRIEALVGASAYHYFKTQRETLSEISGTLKTDPSGILTALEKQKKQLQELEQELKQYRQKEQNLLITNLFKEAAAQNQNWVLKEIDAHFTPHLKSLSSSLLKQLVRGVVILVTQEGESSKWGIACTPESKEINALTLNTQISQHLSGKGGGSTQFAMGSGKRHPQMTQILERLKQYLSNSIGVKQ